MSRRNEFRLVVVVLLVMVAVGAMTYDLANVAIAQAQQDYRAAFTDYPAVARVYDQETDKAVEATVDVIKWAKGNPDATLNQIFRRLERRLLRNSPAQYQALPEAIRAKREALIAAAGGDDTAQSVVDFDARVAALMTEVKQ